MELWFGFVGYENLLTLSFCLCLGLKNPISVYMCILVGSSQICGWFSLVGRFLVKMARTSYFCRNRR